MTLVDERQTLAERTTDLGAARRAMIDSQLRVSGVNDPAILAAFATIAREDFVPPARRALAYADRAVPLDGSTVLAPALTHGQMLVAAAPTATDTVLVISRSGYLAALAGTLAGSVTCTTPDSIPVGPFSLVLVDGAVDHVPAALAATLAEGGRLVSGLVDRGVARLAYGRKIQGEIALAPLGDADFAVLPEFTQKPGWSF